MIIGDQRETARVLRAALEEGEQGYVVHNVLSGEEAILELARVSYRLMITESRLPGISGIELLERVRRRWPTIAAILIANTPLQEVQHDLEKAGLSVAALFAKPLDVPAITDAVRRLLGGRPLAAEKPTPTTADKLSEEQRAILGGRLSTLLTEIGAQGIALINHEGRILLREGSFEELPRFRELAVLLANTLALSADIAAHLGDQLFSTVHYYQGGWSDLFVLSAGVHHFLVFAFAGGSQRQMGAVLRYGKPAAQEIATLVEGGAVAQDAAVSSREAARPSAEGGTEAPIVPLPITEQESGEPVAFDIDLDDLSSLAADTGELDRFWEEAAASSTRLSDDALSLDEAVEQGLFPADESLD